MLPAPELAVGAADFSFSFVDTVGLRSHPSHMDQANHRTVSDRNLASARAGAAYLASARHGVNIAKSFDQMSTKPRLHAEIPPLMPVDQDESPKLKLPQRAGGSASPDRKCGELQEVVSIRPSAYRSRIAIPLHANLHVHRTDEPTLQTLSVTPRGSGDVASSAQSSPAQNQTLHDRTYTDPAMLDIGVSALNTPRSKRVSRTGGAQLSAPSLRAAAATFAVENASLPITSPRARISVPDPLEYMPVIRSSANTLHCSVRQLMAERAAIVPGEHSLVRDRECSSVPGFRVQVVEDTANAAISALNTYASALSSIRSSPRTSESRSNSMPSTARP
jgi:hypothetical protein